MGDNVGDIAGMGADLFGSFAESTCAALVIAAAAVQGRLGMFGCAESVCSKAKTAKTPQNKSYLCCNMKTITRYH